MHLDIDGTGGAFMTSLQQLNIFEARISLFKSLDCPLALAAAGRNQRFTRYPPVINHNQGGCNCYQYVSPMGKLLQTVSGPHFHLRLIMILTHWGRVTHICVSDLTSIGTDNGLSPGRRQAIIRTNVWILSIRPLGTNFSEFLVEILIFSFKKMRLKLSPAKRRPFCLGLNELTSAKRCWLC